MIGSLRGDLREAAPSEQTLVPPPLEQRMAVVIRQLGELSSQLRPLILEAASLTEQAEQRAARVAQLEAEELSLSQELSVLRTMTKGQADAVAKLIAEAERRSQRHDRLYFMLGAFVTITASFAVLFVGKMLGW